MKSTLLQFIPAAFCALLSLLSLTGRSQIVFLAFLPMCFFFAAIAMNRMQREIVELRAKVQELTRPV